ncbi:MAG: hypothetical protein ACRD2Z_06045 [Thermoanaerobaculia bacterium]
MSLKVFHIVFITCSGLLALGTAAWALATPDGWEQGLLAAGALAVLVALVPYAVWFRRKMRRIEDPRSRFTVLVWLAAAGLAPETARACSVCWGGDSGSPWIDASVALFAFMLLLTYGVLGGGILGFVMARRRARREESS